MADIMRELRKPFPASQISWRVGATARDKKTGIALAYIDARDVMNRLDEVFGLSWQTKYSHADKKTICDIGCKIDGEWVWRSGGAGDTDIEAEKGAISDAFKRAAVLWGIGRYLYDLPNEWVPLENEGRKLARVPTLPKWATPEGWEQPADQKAPGPAHRPANGGAVDMSPKARAQRIAAGVAGGDAAGAALALSEWDQPLLDSVWKLLDAETQDKLTAAWPQTEKA